MDNKVAIELMSALAQPTRLRVFLELRRRPEGLPVGELARLIDTPPNTMSTHLSILSRGGAVVASRSGRVVTYAAAPDVVGELATFLSNGG